MNRADISATIFFIVILVLTTVSLTGCSGGTNVKATVAGANLEIAKAKAALMSKPLVEVSIPVPNCVGDNCMMHVVVRHPGGGSGASDYVPYDDPWARVAERAVGGLVTAGGIYLGGEAAANIVRGTSAGIVDALKVQPAPTVLTQPAPIVTPPIVVEQPPPLVVATPDPIVITQPAPIIVTQPDPIIVTQPAPSAP